VTPSPESKTIPVDFPVANLTKLILTKRVLLVQLRRQLGLEIFRKKFPTFFFYAWWDSCLLQSAKLDINWALF